MFYEKIFFTKDHKRDGNIAAATALYKKIYNQSCSLWKSHLFYEEIIKEVIQSPPQALFIKEDIQYTNIMRFFLKRSFSKSIV